MTTKSTTTYTYVCDFCGSEHDTELAQFADRPPLSPMTRQTDYVVDACKDCVATRTLAELKAAINARREADKPASSPRRMVAAFPGSADTDRPRVDGER